jgi:hypothetical protein
VNFIFISSSDHQSLAIEPTTFQVRQIWQQLDNDRIDVSHLIDRTYDYHSVRELRWHLADRFSSLVRSVGLSRI